MAMSNLPPEILIDILSRLPVKDLLRFRCNSKRWCRLIDGREFIEIHRRKSVETSGNHSVILRRNAQLLASDFESLDGFAEFSNPVMCYSNRMKILGACSGLLCIGNVADDIAVWNPATKRYRFVPHSAVELKRRSGTFPYRIRAFGFGYDPISEDFKLVRLVQFFELDQDWFECEVMVYSMNRNFWKRIDDMPYLCCSQKIGVFASGCLHWVVTQMDKLDSDSLIVALDLGSEAYREMPLPEYDDKEFDMQIGVLGGCLCMIASFHNVRVDLWLMKKYGVKDSWSKTFSIVQPEVVRSYGGVKPLAYSRDRRKILLGDKYSLIWYDLESDRIERIKVRGMPVSFEALVLPQTLVPLHPYRRTEEKRKGLEKMRKRRDDFLSQGFKLVL